MSVVGVAGAIAELATLYRDLDGDQKLAISIENETDQVLSLDAENVPHGKYKEAPPSQIQPGQAGVFSGRDKDGSIFTGFEALVIYTGGSAFQCFFLASNPQVGSIKSHAAIAPPSPWRKDKIGEYEKSLTDQGGEHDWGGAYKIIRVTPGDQVRFIVRHK